MRNYTQEGININTFHLLFQQEINNATIDMQLSKGLFEADYFNYYRHDLWNELIHKVYINRILFPNIHKTGKNTYSYRSNEEQFDFSLLHPYFKEFFQNDPEIYQKLLSNQKKNIRVGTCQYSIVLACHLNNSKLVMGKMPQKDGSNILHRFVEVEYQDQPYVLDIAKDLIMKKEDYYQVSHFQEIGSISSSNLRAIYNFGLETNLLNHTKIISLFGNEILNDLEKKKLIKTKNTKIPNFNSFID